MQHVEPGQESQRAAPAEAHPRVPTPHLHLAARGAAWLERPQPQLVAAAKQEFIAEEDSSEPIDTPAPIDPWIMPSAPQPPSPAQRAMSSGSNPSSPAKMTGSATPDAYAVYSGSSSIKPSAKPPAPPAAQLSVRPSSPTPPSRQVGAPPKAGPATNERISSVEKHTAELSQHLSSVANTLAMLEGDDPTEICLEQKEVTLVIREAGDEQREVEQTRVESFEEKIAALAPSTQQPKLTIVAAEVEEAPLVVEAGTVETVATTVQQEATPRVAIAETAAHTELPAAPVALPVAPAVEVDEATPAAVHSAEKFQPQWEVDQFQWPDVLQRLHERAGDAIGEACETIQSGCAAGQKVLAVTSIEEATGSTTLLLTLGKELAQRGMRVAIVDADFDRPTLAERTGLRIQHGWEATLAGSLPLEEVSVTSLQDGVTLVPLVARQGVSSTMASLHAAKHLRRLCEHFDAVLIDAGVGSENIAALATATADDALDIAVVLTVDQRRCAPGVTDEVVGRLRHCGINSIQLGETFVSA
jgi:Mrp family chromosome partitioning ATPase